MALTVTNRLILQHLQQPEMEDKNRKYKIDAFTTNLTGTGCFIDIFLASMLSALKDSQFLLNTSQTLKHLYTAPDFYLLTINNCLQILIDKLIWAG